MRRLTHACGDTAVKAVLRGQLVTFASPGEAWVRRPAPEDALWIDLDCETLLVSASAVNAALGGSQVRSGVAELRLSPSGDAVLVEAAGTGLSLPRTQVARLLAELAKPE